MKVLFRDRNGKIAAAADLPDGCMVLQVERWLVKIQMDGPEGLPSVQLVEVHAASEGRKEPR